MNSVTNRQSSCEKARGIPPAALQVLHLLSYPRGSIPSLAGWYPLSDLARGYPSPDLAGGYPIPGKGYLILGYPSPHLGLGYPPEGTWDQWLGYPRKDMVPVGVLWDGDGIQPRCGQADTCENSTFPSYYVRGR